MFLSVLDVHVVRAPVAGRVVHSTYVPGKFLNAELDKASEENERRALLIEAATEDDEQSSQRLEQRGMAYWQFVERFGPDPNAQALGESTAALYTPRNLCAIQTIAGRVRNWFFLWPFRHRPLRAS